MSKTGRLIFITVGIRFNYETVSFPDSDKQHYQNDAAVEYEREVDTVGMEQMACARYNERNYRNTHIVACQEVGEVCVLFCRIRRDVRCLVINQRLDYSVTESHNENSCDICPVRVYQPYEEESEHHEQQCQFHGPFLADPDGLWQNETGQSGRCEIHGGGHTYIGGIESIILHGKRKVIAYHFSAVSGYEIQRYQTEQKHECRFPLKMEIRACRFEGTEKVPL